MEMNVAEAVAKPTPEINRITRPFWEAAAEHRFVLQRCRQCGRFQYMPLERCPSCSGSYEWVDASGKGVLHTFTIMRVAYHPAFNDEVPYNVSVVELEEGPLMVTNVVGCENDELEIGAAVEVVFEDVSPGVAIAKFRLTGGEA